MRLGTGGTIFHVINRGACGRLVFSDNAVYADFEQLLEEARRRFPLLILSYCLMPNHFHLVVWPQGDGQLSAFMKWLTGTFAQRIRAREGTSGAGAVFQGRFKAIPVQHGRHFLALCRYVERNALRAGLVQRAELWRWSSLWQRHARAPTLAMDPWPIDQPTDWVEIVNAPDPHDELRGLRRAIARSQPYGEATWRAGQVERFGLAKRGRGRPVLRQVPAAGTFCDP
jgi:putative transposase